MTETATIYRPFVPSPRQQAIFDQLADPSGGNLVVLAVAGSGKTTTILKALEVIPRDQSAQFYAFNKAIADTLKAKIPPKLRNVTAGTFHSVGYRALLKHFGMKGLEPQSGKIRTLCRKHLTYAERSRYEAFAVRLVSLAKSHGIGTAICPDDLSPWEDLVAHHEIYLDDKQGSEAEGIRIARDLLGYSTQDAETDLSIDFDDQLYLPILWDLPLERKDWVFVDEAQDTNAVRREFVGKTVAAGGRIVAVGDPHQAIYGFSGASHDAIDLIRERWRAHELPLDVCYRCPAAVIAKAQEIVPMIQPRADAPAGVVEEISTEQALAIFGPGDAILCRNNAPLIDLAYEALRKGIGVQILGRDLGKALHQLVDKMGVVEDLEELDARLQTYRDRECRKLRLKDQEAKAESIEDRVNGLQAISDHLPEDQKTLEALRAAIDRLFGELGERGGTGRLTLSTVHKAKGGEWPKVGILCPELMPARWAKQPWQQQQEQNLQYVAWTRATEALYFLR